MKEIWIPVKGYEGLYEVSNLGNVRSLSRTVTYSTGVKRVHKAKTLKQETTNRRYKRVTLSKNGEVKRYSVHRLIAIHFIENKFGYPEVNHIDHDKTNNKAINLEWVTKEQNERWNVINNKTAANTYKLTPNQVIELRELKRQGISNKELSVKFGINERNVRRVYNRETYKNIK